MRAVVVGLGSMGRRRIRLLQTFFPGVDVVGVDPNESRRLEAEETLGIYADSSLRTISGKGDIAFVTAPPAQHAALTTELLSRDIHVFSEINLLSDGYAENLRLAKERDLLLFLSSTQMYRKEIEYISGQTRGKDRLFYRCHIGQYLLDWHPWEDYRNFFASHSRTNGCREIFAIELPWLTDAFGEIVRFTAMSHKLTSLAIDFPDCYAVTFEHQNGVIGQLAVDLASRKATRELLVVGEDLYLSWGGRPDNLFVYDPEDKEQRQILPYGDDVLQDSRYADNIVENAYVAEMADFFRCLEDGGTPRHDFVRDEALLSLIDEIEEGA